MAAQQVSLHVSKKVVSVLMWNADGMHVWFVDVSMLHAHLDGYMSIFIASFSLSLFPFSLSLYINKYIYIYIYIDIYKRMSLLKVTKRN